MKKRFHAAGICDCCDAPPECIDCGAPQDFPWRDGRCSRCGDEKWDREHPPNRDIQFAARVSPSLESPCGGSRGLQPKVGGDQGDDSL
jgi:hypothetical protein